MRVLAYVCLILTACAPAIRPARLVTSPPAPPVSALPPPPLPTEEEAKPPTEAPPGCPQYCEGLAAVCGADPSVFRSADACLRDCRMAEWDAGEPGQQGGNTLACRFAWLEVARQDPTRCLDAGMLSPACNQVRDAAPTMVAPYTGGNCVIGLYDSTDGLEWSAWKRSRDVILGKRVRAYLHRQGLELRLFDANLGLPQDIGACRAVITSFFDSTLVDARGYALWLAGILKSERKVIILNDYGAYQDSGTKEYLDHGLVNLPLRELGVLYDAQWTGDARKLKVTARDKALFPKVPSVKRAAHYFRFQPARKDLQMALEVTRKDLGDSGGSLVAFTSGAGGMALTRYYEDRDGNPVIRLEPFLARALGLSP